MTEPRRLTEDGVDSLQKQLLNAGRSYRASSQTRLRTAAALGIGVVPLVATSKAAASSLAVSPFAKIATVGLVATGASFLAYQAFTPKAPEPSVAPSVQVAISNPAPAPVAPAPEPEKPASPAVVANEVTPEPTEQPPVVTNAPAPVQPRSSDALSAELARLDGARKKLSAGQATAALDTLDAYGREFPRGSLRLEASVLRIEALAKAGRTTEARDRAKRFLSAHPNSVLAARVKRYAGE
jgi:hypothetical protein